MITAKELEEWKAICEAATPGPWHMADDWTWEIRSANGKLLGNMLRSVHHGPGNAQFVTQARVAWPRVIDAYMKTERLLTLKHQILENTSRLAGDRITQLEKVAEAVVKAIPYLDTLVRHGHTLEAVINALRDAGYKVNQ